MVTIQPNTPKLGKLTNCDVEFLVMGSLFFIRLVLHTRSQFFFQFKGGDSERTETECCSENLRAMPNPEINVCWGEYRGKMETLEVLCSSETCFQFSKVVWIRRRK